MSCTAAKLAVAIAFAFVAAHPTVAHAYADIVIENDDGAGEGFNDATPATPVGGNTGTTVGEQRLIAVQHAADLWGKVLDSEVEIRVQATFDPLGCMVMGTLLAAQASPGGYESGVTGDGADPSWVYPRALADRLDGVDLSPGAPDIHAEFNSDYDDGSCAVGPWYYGLDGKPGMAGDLVGVALHELGHGLGVTHTVSGTTGALIFGALDPFAAHVTDNAQGKSWMSMTDLERKASFSNVREVVWDGANVTTAAADFLNRGTPILMTTPTVGTLSGLVSDAVFGTRATSTSVSADLVIGNPIDGCAVPIGSVVDRVVLLRPACTYSAVARNMELLGAAAVLMVRDFGWDSPPPPLDGEDAPDAVGIPAIGISELDAQALETAIMGGAVTIGITGDPNRLVGADANGHVYLHATKPDPGDLAHFDTLARPSLLMEPVADPPLGSGVDLTLPMLRDMGWEKFCGNGRLDQKEECDDATDNDDDEPNACRTTCVKASCGDRVVDKGEACDDGALNSDLKANACRRDCREARCGDGAVDKGETCDEGDANDDEKPNACRTDCTPPSCGDGVRDADEDCDDGKDNDDTTPDACRTDCKAADCGDGVLDSGEECDDGQANDDSLAGACRLDCKFAHCGDGVVDDGEACDEGSANSDAVADACRSDCRAARCGDGVLDDGERCDDGGDAGNCDVACASADEDGGVDGGDGAGGGAHRGDSGCGCRAIGQVGASASRGRCATIGLALVLGALRRRRARRAA